MRKEFLQFDTERNNALKLAHKIYLDGFFPDLIYVSLRGGASMGHVISEYFKIVQRRQKPVVYAAVVARSYTGVAAADNVKIEGWTYPPERLRIGDKILLVDDIFDSGKTINHLAQFFLNRGILRSDLKIVVHDYKYYYDKEEQLPIQPDYWCRKHEISVNKEDIWIHYMHHELVGLTEEELEEYYYSQDPQLRDVLALINEK